MVTKIMEGIDTFVVVPCKVYAMFVVSENNTAYTYSKCKLVAVLEEVKELEQ